MWALSKRSSCSSGVIQSSLHAVPVCGHFSTATGWPNLQVKLDVAGSSCSHRMNPAKAEQGEQLATSTATTASNQGHAAPVTVSYRGRSFQVPQGTKLRTAMLQNSVTPHNGRAQLINCRGIGSCGTCAVEIRGPVQPADWTAAERLRLNFPPHSTPGNQRLRLACQVQLQGDVQVIKYDKFWGQGDAVLPDLRGGSDEFSVPLGELEFILDRQHQQK